MRTTIAAMAAVGMAMAALPTRAEEVRLGIELNKLEAHGDACRTYLVFENRTDRAFSDFRLDLVLFGPDGVIARRMAVNAAPLPAGKTLVKLFDVSDLACDGIGSVLLNDVLVCRDHAGEHADCAALVTATSRAGVPLRT